MRSEDATSRTAAARLVAVVTLTLFCAVAPAQPVGYGHSLPTGAKRPRAAASSTSAVASRLPAVRRADATVAGAGRPGLIKPAGLRTIPGPAAVTPAFATSPPQPPQDAAEKHVGTIHVLGPIADTTRRRAAVGDRPVTVSQLMKSFGGLAADADGRFLVYPGGSPRTSREYHIYNDGGVALSAGDVIVFMRERAPAPGMSRADAPTDHAAGLAATRAAAAAFANLPTVKVLHVGASERLSGFLTRHGYAGLPSEAYDVVRPDGVTPVHYVSGADPILEPGSTIVIKPRHYWSRDVVTAEAGTEAPIASAAPAVVTPPLPARVTPAPATPTAATPVAVTEMLGRPDGTPTPPALFGPRLAPTDRAESGDRAGSAGRIAIEPAAGEADDVSVMPPPGRTVASADASVLRTDAVVEELPPPPIDGPGVLAWRSPPTLGPPAETQIADADTNGAEPIEAIALAGAADDVASVANAGPSATLLILLSLPFVAAVGVLAWLAGVRFLVGGETAGVGLSAAEDATETDASPAETVAAADDLTTETTPVEVELTEIEPAEVEPENTEIVAPAAMPEPAPEPIEVAPADRPAPLTDDGSPAPADDDFHDETLRRLLRDDFPVEIEPVRLPASLRLFGRSPGLARLRVDAAASPTARGPHFASSPADRRAATAEIAPAAAVSAASPNAALVDAILRQAGLGKAGPADRTHTPS